MFTCGEYKINKSHFIFHTGNLTFAVTKGQESYNLQKTSCKDVFAYVNKLLSDDKISIDGKDIPAEILLGGDYKVYHVIIQIFNFSQLMVVEHIRK